MARRYSLSALTVLELSPPDMVSVAKEAGYDHVGLRFLRAGPDTPDWPTNGVTDMVREIKRRLDDTGLSVLDIEVFRFRPDVVLKDYLPAVEAAAHVGAKHLLCTGQFDDEAQLADMFGAFCALVKPFGLVANLEFVPFTQTTSLQHAARAMKAVEAAGHDNGGVLIDPIHLYRSGGDAAQVAALPAHWFRYAQLCDAPVPAPADMAELIHQARFERLYPGEGGLPLADLFRALPSDIPLAVEAPKDHLRKSQSSLQRAKDVLEASQKLFAAL